MKCQNLEISGKKPHLSLIWFRTTEKFNFCFLCLDLEHQYVLSYVQLHITHNYIVVYIMLSMSSFLNENVNCEEILDFVWGKYSSYILCIFFRLQFIFFTWKALHQNALNQVHNFFANDNHFNLRDRRGKCVPLRTSVVAISSAEFGFQSSPSSITTANRIN